MMCNAKLAQFQLEMDNHSCGGYIYIYCFLIILGFFQWMVMPIDNPKETTPQYLSATSCECQAQQDGLTAAANAAKDSVKKNRLYRDFLNGVHPNRPKIEHFC